MAMESAENVLCGTKAEQQNRRSRIESFYRKSSWSKAIVWHASHIQREEYKVEILELEETIEVLSQWENQRTEEILKNTAEGTAEKTENAIYGICIDIGTTTLAALLVNLKTEADCQTAVSVNHQRTYGADVISRIDASNNGKKWEMQRCIRQDLQKLVGELAEKEGIHVAQIQRIVIAGNTTMCHLLRGFSCETLGSGAFSAS